MRIGFHLLEFQYLVEEDFYQRFMRRGQHTCMYSFSLFQQTHGLLLNRKIHQGHLTQFQDLPILCWQSFVTKSYTSIFHEADLHLLLK